MKKITLKVCLALSLLLSGVAKAQLTQDFETWPPTDWTIESTNLITWDAEPEGITGQSASVLYDFDQNESLISPVFSLPAGNPILKFNVSLSYYWSVDPNNNYDCLVSISDDGGFTWTQIWDESLLGVFDNYVPYAINIPLTAYAGGTNLKLKFNYVGNDGAQLLIDDVSADLPPACAPVSDLTNTSATMTTAVFSWTSALENFEYVLDNTASDPAGAGTATTLTTYSATGLDSNTTYYFHVRATMCADGNSDWTTISFTTAAVATGCLDATSGLYPAATYTPVTCDGITVNIVTTLGYAGEYSNVNVELGQTYTFQSSNASEYITISADDGITATVYGPTPLVWVSTVAGTVRFYTHTDVDCGEDDQTLRTRSIICGVPSNDTPDFFNLQSPNTLSFVQGGSGTVYGQVYEAGLTDVIPNIAGQAPGIQAWVGISPIGSNTNPNTWTTWVDATHNAGYVGNNDEYQATIGGALVPGTYYYATRFRLNNGPFVYGGTDNGAWDGTAHLSGIMTIDPPTVPANDECIGAIELIPGVDFAAGAVTGTTLAATTDALIPSCQANYTNNVWYKVTVPASGIINIETNPVTGSPFTDSVMVAYSGDCASLTPIECDDDDSVSGLFSLLNLTGRTPGEVIYIGIWRYSLGIGLDGAFQISAYDPNLATNQFGAVNGLKAYPNPVKNFLNLSYTKNISNVAVFNILGQEVITKTVGANQSQVDMSHLANGAYMVKVTADNEVKTIKVIKQ